MHRPRPVPSILGKLQDLARKARDRVPMPERVRDVLRRFDPKPPAPAAPEPAPEPVEPVAPKKKSINWELRSQAEIVDHIISHYHEGLRRDLPALVDAARKLHREHPAAPGELADELAELYAELDGHMLKEETVLFPELRTGARGGQLDMPIRMMERDHESHDERLARIREHTANLTAPADAPPAWQDLYAKLAALEADLRQHIYLEDNILFARATGDRD
jgi:iron-sulfur cluster repair di-iron protein